MKHTLKLLGSAILLSYSASSYAEIKLNGFARVAAGIATSLDGEGADGEKETREGFDDKLRFSPGSLFALQFSSDVGENVSATVQLISRGSNDFKIDVEWAYLSYQLSDEFLINIGRLRVPFFRYSDFLDVGYAYTWLKPPSAVYNMPYRSYDGASLLYRSYIGDSDIEVQTFIGSVSNEIEVDQAPAQTELDEVFGLNFTLTRDWLYLRGVYITSKATFDVNSNNYQTLIGGLTMLRDNPNLSNFSAQFQNSIDEFAIESDTGSFAGIGIGAMFDNLNIQAEITQSAVDNSLVADRDRRYVSVSYQINEWTPYILVQKVDDSANLKSGQFIPDIPGLTAAQELKAGALAFLQSQEDDEDGKYYSIGTRYDFHPSASFKADFTRWDGDDGEVDDVATIAIDMVF